MLLLLDHCVWKATTRALRTAGFMCLTLKEAGRAEARNSEVLALAQQREAVLVTRDSDFTDRSHYPLGTHLGIVWLDITPASMPEVHRTLCQTLSTVPIERLRGALVTVTPTTYTLHRPPGPSV